MEILIGIVIVLGGGYFWCAGGWYSRIVAAVLFVPLGALCVGGLIANATAPNQLSPQAVGGIIIGGIAGWYFAAWPRLYWQHKVRSLTGLPSAGTTGH